MANIFSTLPETFFQKLESQNITNPTKVQEEVIPVIREGKNTVFQSETGTGKTLAYLLPIFEKLSSRNNTEKHVEVLICAPTFELASQIKQAAQTFSDFKTALLIGGSSIKRQVEVLKEKPEIVVGTPARIVELIRLKKLKTQGIKSIVFDEVDRLLKKEVFEETKELISLVPPKSQKIACTATVCEKTKNFFRNAKFVVLPDENVLSKNISHWAFYAESRNKIDVLIRLIRATEFEKILVFTSRLDQVEKIKERLMFKKIGCAALHAKTDKQLRKAAIDRFRSGKEKILITSDLSARGLDIQGITHIVQLDFPEDEDFFIHRAGRTARAGKKGVNIVIGDEFELNAFSRLEKKLKIVVYPKEIRDGKIVEPRI